MLTAISVLLSIISATVISVAQTKLAPPAGGCGEVVTIPTHDRTTTRYTLARGQNAAAPEPRIALALLVGGGGNINLDGNGCPRSLSRNALMRMLPLFHAAGFVTALVDAPSDSADGDGLAGFRNAPEHANDLGKIIADVRSRTNGPVWIVGHSRGTISAANAAARLSGPGAPDGVILLSAMMAGDARARKAFVAQTVFDVPLEAINTPVLAIGHVADSCVRSPSDLMDKITARTQGVREQAATVTGGPIKAGRTPGLPACEVNEPHDFIDQQAEVAAGIARFIRGGSF